MAETNERLKAHRVKAAELDIAVKSKREAVAGLKLQTEAVLSSNEDQAKEFNAKLELLHREAEREESATRVPTCAGACQLLELGLPTELGGHAASGDCALGGRTAKLV